MSVSEAEIRSYFDKLSNWGRWGADDECGTLHVGVSRDAVWGATAFDIDPSAEVVTEPPTAIETSHLRELDPLDLRGMEILPTQQRRQALLAAFTRERDLLCTSSGARA